MLNACSPFLISGPNLLKHGRATHILDTCSPILVSGHDPLKQGKRLTYWIQRVTRSRQ